jgi:hypothetical protein
VDETKINTYLTEERHGLAGEDIQASSLEEAKAIAETWRREMLVPPTFKVLGERHGEVVDLDELQRKK